MKERIEKLLPSNRFARSVSILMGGTGLSQALTILASPLLTRIYGPDDFGLLAVYSSLLSILVIIASLRYQLAIPLPDSDKEAAQLVFLSLIVVIVIALFIAIVVALFSEPIGNFFNVPILAKYLWLVPLGFLLMGMYQVFTYWAIREKAFSDIARTNLTQAISMVLIQLAGYKIGVFALLLGQVSGQAAGTARLARISFKKIPFYLFKREMKLSSLNEVSKRYWRFPVYSTWGGLFNAASVNAPALLFAILFSPAVSGLYLVAQRVVLTPVRLISLSVAQVYFGDVRQHISNRSLSNAIFQAHKALAIFAFFPILLFVVIGKPAFTTIFGDSYAQSGVYAQLMAPWLYLEMTLAPFKKTLSAMNYQFLESLLEIGQFIGRIAAIFIGFIAGSALIAVALLSFVSVIVYVFLFYAISKVTDSNISFCYLPKFNYMYQAVCYLLLILLVGFVILKINFFLVVGTSIAALTIHFTFFIKIVLNKPESLR